MMINWETLKLTTTSIPMSNYYIWLIPLLIVIFILGASIILFLPGTVEDKTPIEKETGNKNLLIIALIVGTLFTMFFYKMIKNVTEGEYYKITVEIENPEMTAEQLAKMPKIPVFRLPIEEETKTINKRKSYSIDNTNQIESYNLKYTKIYPENGKLYFTTILGKPYYVDYPKPEYFKNDITKLVKYASEQILSHIPSEETMKDFTEQHATDTKTMPKFEEAEEKQ